MNYTEVIFAIAATALATVTAQSAFSLFRKSNLFWNAKPSEPARLESYTIGTWEPDNGAGKLLLVCLDTASGKTLLLIDAMFAHRLGDELSIAAITVAPRAISREKEIAFANGPDFPGIPPVRS